MRREDRQRERERERERRERGEKRKEVTDKDRMKIENIYKGESCYLICPLIRGSLGNRGVGLFQGVD